MALSGARLGASIKAKVAAKNDQFDAMIGDKMDWLFDAIGEAVIEEVQAYAQVVSTVTVISVSGVTTGAGISGPGTGTATGTIT
jgi:hypothetical protein